jgi:peptide/nickel transport system substrate-binding protein
VLFVYREVRRHFVAGFAVIGLVVACGPAAPATPNGSGAPAKPPVPQKLTWAAGLFVPSIHPFISQAGTQRRYDIYDTTVHRKANGDIAPGVATAWRSIDPLTWELTVRQDMTFHDGSPLSAGDVAFSINRAMEPERRYGITSRLTNWDRAELVNPTMVRVITKAPDPIFLKRLALISVLPKGYLERVGDDVFQNKPIGSGPYRVVEYREATELRLEAFPEHPWRKPTLTEVVIKNVPEASARLAGLHTGDVDLADQIPIDQGKAFEAQGFKVIAIQGGSSEGYQLDTVFGDQPIEGPTRDKRVRQAMNYAVDKEAIAKNIYQGYTRVEACQPIQPETFGFNPNLKPYPYDPAKAKQLLAEAGYPNGFTTQLRARRSSSEVEPIALFVQAQLREVGIIVEYQPIEQGLYSDMFNGRVARPPMFRPGLTNRPAHDADFALTWFSGQQRGGVRRYNNPEFDRYYLASQQEVDEKKRLDLLHKALEVFCEDPPYLFLVEYAELVVLKGDIQGAEKRIDREQDLSALRRS